MKKKLSPNEAAKMWNKVMRKAWPLYQKGIMKSLKLKSPWIQLEKTEPK